MRVRSKSGYLKAGKLVLMNEDGFHRLSLSMSSISNRIMTCDVSRRSADTCVAEEKTANRRCRGV